MYISVMRSGVFRIVALFFCIMLFFTAGASPDAMAESTGRAEVQQILQDCLIALWTGREAGPELMQRQQALQSSLKGGTVTGEELDDMVAKAFSNILNNYKTSRYNLKSMSESIDNFLSPFLNWQDVRKIMWRVCSSPADRNDPMMIKIGTLAPPGTPWITLPETVIFPELETLTDGKLLFKIYGGGVLGDDADILKKMDGHQVDGCGCTALGVLEASPETSALLVPGLFKNYEEVDYICQKFRKRLDTAFEQKGYILAGIIDTGFLYLFSKNKITGLEDLRRQKVLTWFGAVENALFEELGIEATPVTVPEVVSILSMGQADTVLLPPVWMLGMQAYQYTNYYFKPPLLYSPAAIFVSIHTKDRLQQQIGVSETYAHNLQEIIVFEFNSMEPEWKQRLRNYEEKSLKAFEAKCGMKVITFSSEDQIVIEKAARAVEQKLADRVYPKAFVDSIQKALVEYRANH